MTTINAVGNGLSGATGTGNFVGSTSPTLVTPVLGAASATSLTLTSTSGIVGTTTNNNAASGSVGEFVSSVLLIGSDISLSSGVSANITSISLTAGDWDVWGEVWFTGGATTSYTSLGAAINTVSATLISVPNANLSICVGVANGTVGAIGVPVIPSSVSRISIASTTTVYLVGAATFSVSTFAAYGALRARRVR